MNQKQKQNKSQFLFFLSSLIIIIFCFLLLVPKVSSKIFPQKEQIILNSFISQTQKEQKIDPQAYWKFREFYSPGYFDYSKTGLNNNQIKISLGKIGINPDKTDLYFLNFNSEKLVSLDGLTKASKLSEILNTKNLDAKEILFKNVNSIIYKNKLDQILIVTLYSNSEMKKANGFFDYNNNKDINIIDKRNWINITRID